MTTSYRFEDRLLEQLLHVVAEQPNPSAALYRRSRRTRLSLAGAGVAVATVAIVLVATSGNVPAGAYAVESRADGAVSVSINSLRDADGLQRSLRAAGIPAVVDYVNANRRGCAPSGPLDEPHADRTPGDSPDKATTRKEAGGKSETGPTTSQGGSGESAPRSDGGDIARAKVVSSVRGDGNGATTFTIDPGVLEPGENVYITTSAGTVSSIGIAIGKEKPSTGCVTAKP